MASGYSTIISASGADQKISWEAPEMNFLKNKSNRLKSNYLNKISCFSKTF